MLINTRIMNTNQIGGRGIQRTPRRSTPIIRRSSPRVRIVRTPVARTPVSSPIIQTVGSPAKPNSRSFSANTIRSKRRLPYVPRPGPPPPLPRGRGNWNYDTVWYDRPFFGYGYYYDPEYYIIPIVKTVESYSIQDQVDGPCAVYDNNNNTVICDKNLICDNENKCVSYSKDIDVSTFNNINFRLCRNENDTNCLLSQDRITYGLL